MENDTERSIGDAQRLAHMLASLFKLWGLTALEQEGILGVSESQKSSDFIETALCTVDGVERAGLLLSIHAQLRVLFHRNHDLAYLWMRTPNRAFQGQSPCSVACAQGLLGLKKISSYLDQFEKS